MIAKQPQKTYKLGDALPAIPGPVASWPWPGSAALTKWSVDMLRYPLGTLIMDVVDGHPVVAQIQTHSWYGAHPDWPATPHKGTSVFVPTTVNAAGKKVAIADPPDGWGEESPTTGVSENFCPTLPYLCPPRPWGPDPGPRASIADRLGTGGVGVGFSFPKIHLPKIHVHVDFEKIPYVGKALKQTYETVSAGIRIPIEYLSKIARGNSVVQATKDQLGHEIRVYRTAGSYAQLVQGNMAAIGEGTSGAIAAGQALASGQAIDPALIAGVADNIAGGPVGKALYAVGFAAMDGKDPMAALSAIPGLDTATKAMVGNSLKLSQALAQGKSPDPALLNEAMRSLPPDAQSIVNAAGGIGSSAGQHALADQLIAKAKIPDDVKNSLKTGMAMAVAHNLQKTSPHPAAPQSTPATTTPVSGYGPYPDASGTTAGVGNLDRGGGGGHGGGHGGGGWRGGGRAFRGRGWGGRGGWGWGGGPWWPYVVVGDATCATWGDPIGSPEEILPGLRATLIGAGGGPVAIQGADGGLYLLTQWGRGIAVRPCVGMGVGGVDDDVLRAMAIDLLGSLRRTGAPQYATRSVKSFAHAWNTASADTQISTDGKYTREIEGALTAALGALAPGSGAVPAAVL
jgi:hypothetical protein